MKYKWRIENIYDNADSGCAVSKGDFKSHRQATRDLIEEIKSNQNQLKYGLGEKDRTKTIITVESYEEVINEWAKKI